MSECDRAYGEDFGEEKWRRILGTFGTFGGD